MSLAWLSNFDFIQLVWTDNFDKDVTSPCDIIAVYVLCHFELASRLISSETGTNYQMSDGQLSPIKPLIQSQAILHFQISKKT